MHRLISFVFSAHALVLINGDYDTKTGVFLSNSSDFDKEISEIINILQLNPGMTYCEMGGGNGKFMVPLGKAVMPGGKVLVTEVVENSLPVMETAARNEGFDISAILANNTWMGLPPNACDVIMSRMVYHMINETVAVKTYLAQLWRALKPGGHMLILDHDPDTGATTRVNASLKGKMDHRMHVVPRLQEIREFTAAGFFLKKMFEWDHWFHYGFGLLWIHAKSSFQDVAASAQKPTANDITYGSLDLEAISSINNMAFTGVVFAATSSVIGCSVLCLVLRLTSKFTRVQNKGGPVPANAID
eukprot:gnl/MRDRNA2_/MRDRNA2_199409_c0_seq1.p1 gnl/MRDRNA2_/MRDRNA2_199409_c0~~gnl/MRDRNA2_/MRDRNA2_199409_c0_seq1.p1  ORF type:complete len:302 (-),score=49.96 gnl/MRDRNA2_/MRDRNA2_199409_c0_seq1:231-1136(-)